MIEFAVISFAILLTLRVIVGRRARVTLLELMLMVSRSSSGRRSDDTPACSPAFGEPPPMRHFWNSLRDTPFIRPL